MPAHRPSTPCPVCEVPQRYLVTHIRKQDGHIEALLLLLDTVRA